VHPEENFAFEIKDQELPVVLSKEEISRLLFEVTNINITTRTAERVSDIKPVCGDMTKLSYMNKLYEIWLGGFEEVSKINVN